MSHPIRLVSRGLILGVALGVAAAGTAIPVSGAEPVIDTTADAVQTFYQQSGVPHVDRQGRFRSTYDSASSFLPRGLYHMLPCEVSKTITFEPFTGTPDPNLGEWNGDYNMTVNLGPTVDSSQLALLQSVIVPGPGTGTLTTTVRYLPANTVLTYAVGLTGTFQMIEQGTFTSAACPDLETAVPAALLGDAGFNVVMAGEGATEAADRRGLVPPAVLLEQSDAAGVATMVGASLVPHGYVDCNPDCNPVIDPNGVLPPHALPWFNAYKDDPRVFAIGFTDEPLVNAVLDNQSIQVAYDTVLETYNTYKDQTDHPLYFPEFYPPISPEADARWNDFVVNLADAAAHDNYFKNIGEPLVTMAPLAESMRRQTTVASARNKPSWIVPQSFNYMDAEPGGWQGWDFLTPQEMRAYIYTAIIHGATGFFHFAWDSHIMRGDMIGIHPSTPATQYPGTGRVASDAERMQSVSLWRSLDAREASRGSEYGLNAQLETLTPIILSRTSDEPYRVWVDQAPISAAPIRTMLKEDQGNFYLLAVNIDNLTIQAKVRFRFLISAASVLFEGRLANVSGSTLEETFAPFAAHVYEIFPQPPILGDANCDGQVNSLDALTLLQYSAGMGTVDQLTSCSDNQEFQTVAEISGDGVVNSLDALLILQYVAGILDSLQTLQMTAGHEDSDGDFMTNQQETNHSCLNASVSDWDQNPDADGFTNAAELVLSTNPCFADAYPRPATPTGFTARAISPTVIQLNWNLQQDNDSWRIERSLASDGSGYAVLFPSYHASYDKVYDTTVQPNTTYYYRLYAVNPAGDSLYAQASATANTPPQLTVPADRTVTVSGKLYVSVSASDSESDPLTLRAINLPSGASFSDSGNGTGILSWIPTSGQAGQAYPVTFTASDGVNPAVSGTTTLTVDALPPPPPPPVPPTVTISAPTANATVPATGFSFTGSASDADGVSAVQVSITNGKLVVVDRASASYNPSTQIWSFPVQASHLTPGTTPTLSVTAKDTQSNWSSSLTRSVTVSDQGAPTLSITSFSASPSSGTAPLNGVDFTVDVGGTATGSIRYRIDCDASNGLGYNSDVTNTSDPYTAVDVCSYASSGTYTVTVEVTRQSLVQTATTTVSVSAAPYITITTLTASPNPATAGQNVSLTAAFTTNITDPNTWWWLDCRNDGWANGNGDSNGGPFTTGSPFVLPVSCPYTTAGSYTARVKLIRGSTEHEKTVSITVNVPPPAAPTGVTATTPAPNMVRLTWTDNATNETGFKVYESINGATATEVASLGAGSGTMSWDRTGLAADTWVCYHLDAWNAAGTAPGDPYWACAMTLQGPPAAPSGLTPKVPNGVRVDLSWADNSNNETGFRFWREKTSGSFEVRSWDVGAGVTNYTDTTSLQPGQTYRYLLKSFNGGGESSGFTEYTITMPYTVQGLSAQTFSRTQITVTWNDLADELDYVMIREKADGTQASGILLSPNQVLYLEPVNTLTCGTQYRYKIHAQDPFGVWGPWSAYSYAWTSGC